MGFPVIIRILKDLIGFLWDFYGFDRIPMGFSMGFVGSRALLGLMLGLNSACFVRLQTLPQGKPTSSRFKGVHSMARHIRQRGNISLYGSLTQRPTASLTQGIHLDMTSHDLGNLSSFIALGVFESTDPIASL